MVVILSDMFFIIVGEYWNVECVIKEIVFSNLYLYDIGFVRMVIVDFSNLSFG